MKVKGVEEALQDFWLAFKVSLQHRKLGLRGERLSDVFYSSCVMRDGQLIRRSATCDVLYITATCYDLFIVLSAYGGYVCSFCSTLGDNNEQLY